MNRTLVVAAVLVVLAGAYVFFVAGQGSSRSAKDVLSAARGEIHVTTENQREEASTYVIDATYPHFGIPEVDAKINERIALSIAQFKEDVAAYPPVPDSFVEQYEFTSMFDSVYVGPDIVSARFLTSTYMGGAHAMSIVNGLNFYRATGDDVTPLDVFGMTGLTLEEISARAKAELAQKLGTDVIAPEGADPTLDNYSTFVIDKDSVTFIFQVYQVAPYATGSQEVSFPRVR